jgi:hypothetical protein
MQVSTYGKIEKLQDSFSWIKQIKIICFFSLLREYPETKEPK